MGAFFLTVREEGRDAEAIRAAARAHFVAAGFGGPTAFEQSGWYLDCYGQIGGAGPQCVVRPNGDFIACVGTVLYRGLAHAAALAALFDAPDFEAALDDCLGHFVVLTGRAGVMEIRRDRCAAGEVFHDEARTAFSTSFLALARALGGCRVNAPGIYEYVCNGVTLGSETLLSPLRRLDLFESVRVERRAEIAVRRHPLLPAETHGEAEDLAAAMLARLQQSLAVIADAFAGNMTLALSAGYDTRLLLAACRSIGRQPRLFVYGAPCDEDVVIARRIAAGEGLALEHLDKQPAQRLITPEAFPEIMHANFLDYDGMGPGGLITSRAEYHARKDRHRDGAVNLHGGAGEVLRNFFGLPDRPTSTLAIARAFFSQFDIAICRETFSRRAYEARLAAKMADLLGHDGRSVPRREAEVLYPHFRSRSWFGRDIGVNRRYGHFLLPLYEHRFVDAALGVPLAFKRSGNFQARMIRLADPRLAAYPSGYGHDFTADAPWRRAAMDAVLAWRPGLLRRYSYALQQRLRPPPPRSGLLSDAFIGRIIDLKFPVLSEFFRIDRVRDPVQYARMCSLEYLFAQVGAGE